MANPKLDSGKRFKVTVVDLDEEVHFPQIHFGLDGSDVYLRTYISDSWSREYLGHEGEENRVALTVVQEYVQSVLQGLMSFPPQWEWVRDAALRGYELWGTIPLIRTSFDSTVTLSSRASSSAGRKRKK